MSRLVDSARIAIGPSVLSADFLRLGDQLIEMEEAGANYIHFDAMDGRFVPNISIGLPILEAIRRGTSLPIDVHLMVADPERWVDEFCSGGADAITFHVEATPHLHRVAESIAGYGKMAGVAINPATPVEAISELIPYLHQVLVMTVNPGFGGQTFIPLMLSKIRRLRDVVERLNPECVIQVDGGMNPSTIARVVESGATSIVAGSSVINDDASIAENMASLRAALADQTRSESAPAVK